MPGGDARRRCAVTSAAVYVCPVCDVGSFTHAVCPQCGGDVALAGKVVPIDVRVSSPEPTPVTQIDLTDGTPNTVMALLERFRERCASEAQALHRNPWAEPDDAAQAIRQIDVAAWLAGATW